METPPLKTFLLLISFLGFFAILIGTIPSGFMVTTEEYREQTVPDYFEAIDLQFFAETWSYTLNATGGTEGGAGWYFIDIDIGNRDFDMWYKKANQTPLQLYFVHRYTWIIFPVSHKMQWLNYQGATRGTELEGTELDSDVSNPSYTAKCDHFHVKVFFAYNDTLYSVPTEAWNNNNLHMLVGIDFDQQETGMNAWNLIGMILFFQMPNVHPILNMLIAIPVWVCIAWLTFAFIIAVVKSLPFT